MNEFISDNITSIIIAVITLVGGVICKVISVRIRNSSGNRGDVTQKNIHAGGDVAGGDMHK